MLPLGSGLMASQAGAGNVLGSTFEELAEIIEQVVNKDRVGVCIDTCMSLPRRLWYGAGVDARARSYLCRWVRSADRGDVSADDG